jgi:hypothetical protein
VKVEFEKKLFDLCPPEWFNFNPQESSMCWGFSVGDGWYQILYDLFADIKTLVLDEGFEILQVKEKFGGLRVYTSVSIPEVEFLIKGAELRATNTCDVCGKHGNMREKGWLAVRCKEHA